MTVQSLVACEIEECDGRGLLQPRPDRYVHTMLCPLTAALQPPGIEVDHRQVTSHRGLVGVLLHPISLFFERRLIGPQHCRTHNSPCGDGDSSPDQPECAERRPLPRRSGLARGGRVPNWRSREEMREKGLRSFEAHRLLFRTGRAVHRSRPVYCGVETRSAAVFPKFAKPQSPYRSLR